MAKLRKRGRRGEESSHLGRFPEILLKELAAEILMKEGLPIRQAGLTTDLAVRIHRLVEEGLINPSHHLKEGLLIRQKGLLTAVLMKEGLANNLPAEALTKEGLAARISRLAEKEGVIVRVGHLFGQRRLWSGRIRQCSAGPGRTGLGQLGQARLRGQRKRKQ